MQPKAMRTDDAGLAAFAHEAAQSQQGSAAHLSQASRPGDTWSQVIAAQVSLGGRGSTLRDPSACLGGKPVLQTIKNSELAALAADWPIELRVQRKTAALAALQDRTTR